MPEQKYEYTVKNLDTKDPAGLRDDLNRYAHEGWRLHETTEEEQSGTKYYIFERPVD